MTLQKGIWSPIRKQLQTEFRSSYHSPGREIRALLMLLSIFYEPVKSPDSRWNEIMGLEEVKVLRRLERTRNG